jgi:biotin-(acetyl-CoA carboxylase) ligase
MATSLAALHAVPLDGPIIERIIPAFLGQFESVLRRLARGEPALARQWDRLDLLREQWVRVDLGTHQVAGRGQGIDQNGALCLVDGQQKLRLFGGRVIRNHS